MDRMKQCHAKSKRSGQRCKRYATKGMTVCHMHGGNLGSKKAQKARQRAALRHGLYTSNALQEKSTTHQLIKSCREIIKKSSSS